MPQLYSLASLFALLLAAFIITRLLKPRSRVEGLLILPMVLSTLILLLGYLLSAMNQLRNLALWAALSLLVLLLVLAPLLSIARLRVQYLRMPALPRDIEKRIGAADFTHFDTLVLLALAISMAIVAAVNFITIISMEPGNMDAINYHLTRIMYYLEHGNLHYFGTSNWANVIHPNVSTVLMLYTYLISDLTASLTQLVQYFAYFVGLLSVYGITRLLGCNRRRSAFAALIFSLLIIIFMEAASAQNDLVLTAFTGCLLYFLLAYRQAREVKYLWLASVAFALALGVKATMLLVLPSLLLIVIFTLRPRKGEVGTRYAAQLGVGALGLVLALTLITLPSGYGENWRLFGNPLGPQSVREEHSIEGHGLPRLAKNGCLNMLRYGLQFAAVDGVLNTRFTTGIQNGLTLLPRWLLQHLSIDLTDSDDSRRQFHFDRLCIASENCSFWGMLGLLLVWPAVLITLLRGNSSSGMRLFALATVLFFFVQAFASPYDPWRGRYFTTAALFATPTLAGVAFPRQVPWKIYVSLALLLGCATAIFSVFINLNVVLIPFKYKGKLLAPTYTTDRIKQLTREMPDMYSPMLLYDTIVPEHTIVATDTKLLTIEYLFFGDRLSRRIIPLRSFTGTRLPIPPEAQYLLYSDDSPYAHRGDTMLFKDDRFCGTLYIRKLK